MIAFGDWRPLENQIIRDIALVLLAAAVASFGGFTFYRRKKSAEKIAEGIAGETGPVNDEPILKDRMKDALATLKKAGGGKSEYLYDLPWYIIIGPPGAGKTTALVNSGLKFPLPKAHPRCGCRGRRHPLLRLVVYRGSSSDRHRRPLHHTGFRRQIRQGELVLLSCLKKKSAASTHQWRDCGDQC